MKKIITKIGKTWRSDDWFMPESRIDGKPILLLADELEELFLGFANKGEVEITVKVVSKRKVKKRKRTKQ